MKRQYVDRLPSAKNFEQNPTLDGGRQLWAVGAKRNNKQAETESGQGEAQWHTMKHIV